LFDAGISGKKAEERLARHGRDIRDVDALFISHDHSDHTKSVGIFQRKFGMPVYITPRTLAAVNRSQKIGKLERVRLFTAGSSQSFGGVTVHSIPTPHDSVDGVAFVVEDKTHRVGILTDLGHAFEGLKEVLQCHLSEENNEPDRARAIHDEILGNKFPIHVASRHDVSDVYEL